MDTNEGYLMWLIESDNLARELAAAIAAYRRRNGDTAPDTLLVHPERVERIPPTDGLAVRAAGIPRPQLSEHGDQGVILKRIYFVKENDQRAGRCFDPGSQCCPNTRARNIVRPGRRKKLLG